MKILLLNAYDSLTKEVQAKLAAAGHTIEVTWQDSVGIQACRRFEPNLIISCGGGSLIWFLKTLKRENLDQYSVMLIGSHHWREENSFFREGVKSIIPTDAIQNFLFLAIWDLTGLRMSEIDGSRQKRSMNAL